MKGLLISPNEHKFLSNAGDRPPLGLLYISSALEKNNIEHEVIDLNHYKYLDLINKVKKETPDFIGLSCISSPTIKQIQSLAKELRPYTKKLIAGGPHISERPSDLEGVVDTIVYSYGEEGMLRALTENSEHIYEPVDINKYPLPNRIAVSDNEYSENLFGLNSTTMITGRGCTYHCSFCSKSSNKIKLRNMDNIEEELIQIIDLGYRTVHFVNENFTSNRQHANGVMELMKKYHLNYRADLRADIVTPNLVKKLKDTGCIMTAIGIESGDDKVLYYANKKTNTSRIENAVELLGKEGIYTKGYFIFGLTYQDEKSCEKTLKFAKKLKKKGMVSADFYPLIPFPGTPMEIAPSDYGIKILHKDYDKYLQANKTEVESVVETQWLSKDKIEYYCKVAKEMFR